jgi:hypothetical protein
MEGCNNKTAFLKLYLKNAKIAGIKSTAAR